MSKVMTNTMYKMTPPFNLFDHLLKNTSHWTQNIVFIMLLDKWHQNQHWITLLWYFRSLWNSTGLNNFPINQSTYLVVCSSGGVPATSALGSEVVLSTVTPADPGDPAGDVAAVWEQNSPIAQPIQNLLFWHLNEFPFVCMYLIIKYYKQLIAHVCLPWSDAF